MPYHRYLHSVLTEQSVILPGHLATFKKLASFKSQLLAATASCMTSLHVLCQIENFHENALDMSEIEMRMLKFGLCHVTLC